MMISINLRGLRALAWIAFTSGVIAAVGLVALFALYALLSVGATSPGLVFGWINDVLGIVGALLMLPLAVGLHLLLRPQAPILSLVAMLIGIVAMVAIVILQTTLVVGVLTFEQEAGPVGIAYLPLVGWFLLTGYLGSSSGLLPRGLRMGILAATYIGYPIWAIWLGRRLLQLARPDPIVADVMQLADRQRVLARVDEPGREVRDLPAKLRLAVRAGPGGPGYPRASPSPSCARASWIASSEGIERPVPRARSNSAEPIADGSTISIRS